MKEEAKYLPIKITRTDLILILEDFMEWLEENGYTDTDWRAEEPLAINEYLNERKILKENLQG